MVSLNNITRLLPLLGYRLLPLKYVEVVPAIKLRGHQCWSTSAETHPVQTGSTGINESSVQRLYPATSQLQGKPSHRPCCTAAAPTEAGVWSSRKGSNAGPAPYACSAGTATSFCYPPGKMGFQPSQAGWGPSGSSTSLHSHCKACSAAWPLPALATVQSLPRGTVEPRLKGEQAVKGPAASIKCHSSTTDLDLPPLGLGEGEI